MAVTKRVSKRVKSEETYEKMTKNNEWDTSVENKAKPLLDNIRLDLKAKNENQKKLLKSIRDNDVTVCVGPAGTGKTILSIYEAVSLLKTHPDIYKKIILLKSISQLKDETLPALPGDAMDKMYFQNMSFFDSLIKLIGEKHTGELITLNKIKFDVVGSFRGRNLSNSIIILDETQNISHDNLKTILTRISDNTKIILLGDPDQIDIKIKSDSSLKRFLDKIKSNQVVGVGVVEFDETDIVRHRLTSYFINLFKEEPIEHKTKQEKIVSVGGDAVVNKKSKFRKLIEKFI